MKRRILIGTVVCFLVGACLGPPDRVSQLVTGGASGLLFAVSLLILSRFGFIKTASNSAHTLICLLLCVLSIACVVFWGIGTKPSPPDLEGCTRLDVHYTGGALCYFFPREFVEKGILNAEEQAYICSFDQWTVTDREAIRAFADLIGQGEYRGRQWGLIDDVPVEITCYQGSDRVASLTVHARSIVTGNKRRFAYQRGLMILGDLVPADIRPLKARYDCATNLGALVCEGLWFGQKRQECPDPNHWCDAVLEAYRKPYVIYPKEDNRRERMFSDSYIARRFTCPGAQIPVGVNGVHSQPDGADPSSATPDRWVSHYAMNANCGTDAPDDTVFLFESQAGWNRHGGPELFTFDNHDPKGGCVLLKGGHVKFIRTEEELHALRWQ